MESKLPNLSSIKSSAHDVINFFTFGCNTPELCWNLMTGQNNLRFLLNDKTNQRKIGVFYFCDLFPVSPKSDTGVSRQTVAVCLEA